MTGEATSSVPAAKDHARSRRRRYPSPPRSRSGAATAFGLAVDSGTAVGNAPQVRVSYDLTGNGSFDRVETYRYFATDPVGGYERYTQAAGLASSSGTLGNLRNGTIRVEVWNAIGNAASTLGVGNQSIIRLPLS